MILGIDVSFYVAGLAIKAGNSGSFFSFSLDCFLLSDKLKSKKPAVLTDTKGPRSSS
jgi:hypothetical protein